MFHYFAMNREEYLTHYHERSNVESAFSMIKRKFGDSLRAKTDTAMRNEVLAKIVCHNLCVNISAWYELGIDPGDWLPKGALRLRSKRTASRATCCGSRPGNEVDPEPFSVKLMRVDEVEEWAIKQAGYQWHEA